jgi:hypothetical protein
MTENTQLGEAEVVDDNTTTAVAGPNVYEENGIVLYDSYDEFVSKVKSRLTQEGQAIVWTRWTLGAHVKAALEGNVYGDHVMDDLERDLGISRKTLYACKTLFETYDVKEMEEKVMPKNLPFRSLNYIARVDDPEKRAEYMEQVAAGEIKAEEIPKLEAGTAEKGEATETGDDTTAVAGEPKSTEDKAAAAIRKAIGAVDAPLDIVLGHINAAENCLGDLDLVSADDDLYDTVTGELAEFRTKLSDLQPRTTSLIEELDKVLG